MKDNWDNNWSDYIKSTLGEYHPPVPDHLWNNLEGKISASNPSVFLTGKFIAGAILSIGMIVGAYLLFSNNNQMGNSELCEHANRKSDIAINPTADLYSTNKKLNLYIVDTLTKKSQAEIPASLVQLKKTRIASTPDFKENSSNKEKKQDAVTNQQSLYTGITNAESSSILHESFHKRIKIEQKTRTKKSFNISIKGGLQYLESTSFFAGIQAEYNWNRLGAYGGIHYCPNQLREFTSGEGAENTTVKVLTANDLQHRINFFTGISYQTIKTKSNDLLVNVGVISKTTSLNGNSNFYNPLMISTGLELRIPVLRKFNTGIYYNYLFKPSDHKINGHQLGIKIKLFHK